jgi:hypothetical protein
VTPLPSTVRINEGDDLDLSCAIRGEITCVKFNSDSDVASSVLGIPEPVIHWTKDAIDVKEDHRIDIYSDRGAHHLEISDVSLCDQGVYRIRAENCLGQVDVDCRLDVIESLDTSKRLQVDGLHVYGTR